MTSASFASVTVTGSGCGVAVGFVVVRVGVAVGGMVTWGVDVGVLVGVVVGVCVGVGVGVGLVCDSCGVSRVIAPNVETPMINTRATARRMMLVCFIFCSSFVLLFGGWGLFCGLFYFAFLLPYILVGLTIL